MIKTGGVIAIDCSCPLSSRFVLRFFSRFNLIFHVACCNKLACVGVHVKSSHHCTASIETDRQTYIQRDRQTYILTVCGRRDLGRTSVPSPQTHTHLWFWCTTLANEDYQQQQQQQHQQLFYTSLSLSLSLWAPTPSTRRCGRPVTAVAQCAFSGTEWRLPAHQTTYTALTPEPSRNDATTGVMRFKLPGIACFTNVT